MERDVGITWFKARGTKRYHAKKKKGVRVCTLHEKGAKKHFFALVCTLECPFASKIKSAEIFTFQRVFVVVELGFYRRVSIRCDY